MDLQFMFGAIGVGLLLAAIYKWIHDGSKQATTPQLEAWQSAAHIAKAGRFEETTHHLGIFTEMQHLLLLGGESKLTFDSDQQRYLYLHFMMGAIDQLSGTIQDEDASEIWQLASAVGQATVAFGPTGTDLGLPAIKSYGCSGVPEYHEAAKTGWEAMQTYLQYVTGKISTEEATKSTAALMFAVRGGQKFAAAK